MLIAARPAPVHKAMTYSTLNIAVADLSTADIGRMAALYLDHYDGSSPAIFHHDLEGKDEAILLFADGGLVGFTTLKTFGVEWQGKPVRIVYSGDTIVTRAHWGQQQLPFAWISRIGGIKHQRPDVALYWMLLVKGHRTFKYLSVFGKSFFPHWEIDRSDLKPLADRLAGDMFGAAYNRDSGVVEFPESRGHLRDDLALPSPEEMDKPGTRYFLQVNPGYRRGHELVCLCELELANMKPLTARVFARGLPARSEQ